MNQEKSMHIKEDFANSLMKGRIIVFLSIFFGFASFVAVFCFLFPSYLTTPDLRKAYPVPLLRVILMILLIASFLLALVSFLLSKQKRLALTGILFSASAIL